MPPLFSIYYGQDYYGSSMFGDPREKILQDIEEYTRKQLSIGEGFLPDHSVVYAEFDIPQVNILYQVVVKRQRVLVYGMEKLKTPIENFDYLFDLGRTGESGSSPAEDRISLFCKRFVAAPYDINELISSIEDGAIEELEGEYPRDEETNEEFFLRNALWLLNPLIH